MPTKPELEAEVEQLKQQLAQVGSQTPPDLAAMQAELEKLKSDLQAVSDERDLAQSAGRAIAEKADSLASQRDDLASQLVEAIKKTADLQAELDQRTIATDDLPDQKDHVFLDGTKYDIIWRSTVKDIVYEGYHKRNLDENHTALVVAKHGG